jgi:hypothetical protein
MMVWRYSETYSSGSEAKVADPYATKDDALAIIKDRLNRGIIVSASIEDHDGNRIEWPEIQRLLGMDKNSN